MSNIIKRALNNKKISTYIKEEGEAEKKMDGSRERRYERFVLRKTC